MLDEGQLHAEHSDYYAEPMIKYGEFKVSMTLCEWPIIFVN